MFRYLLVLLLFPPFAVAVQQAGKNADAEKKQPKRDALKSIESTRGGRHWVNEKTAPPKSAGESLKCLQVEPGWEIQLVAAEPLVKDPVAIAFDERGRMFVVEYGDYPTGPAGANQPPLSRVVFLEDTNGDGRMDRRHVFADRLDFAHSLMAYKGGLLVGAKTKLLYLKDTDGDNKADVRETLFEGFQPAHPQMQIGCPRWGLDNWIYCNYGRGDISRPGKKSKPLTIPRLDFRFHPITMQFGPDSGLSQYGNTFDRFGNRFFCTNRNPVMTTALPYSALHRNPYLVAPKGYYDVAPSGGDTRVYPLVAMKSNYLSHAGTHTSACGTTAYLGDLAGGDFLNSVFVCEPIGHLVTRSVVKSGGVTLTAQRARDKADFLASTDTWFRPASLANGPDGALYLADMYRLWVEHPKFLPPEIARQLDWRAGDDRGRIYRLVPKGTKPRAFKPPATTTDLVGLLTNSNGWRRYLGQRLLVERQAKDAAPLLRKLLQNRKDSHRFGRLHALWTLDGLGALTFADIKTALQDSDVYIRRAAVKLAARFLKDDGGVNVLIRLAADPDVRVRYQVALASGETDDPRATDVLVKLALRNGHNRWFALALLTSCRNRAGAILSTLLRDAGFRSDSHAGRIELVRQLAAVAGARGDKTELAAVFNAITSTETVGAWWQTAVLTGLAEGLPRHRGQLGRTSLAKLIEHPPKSLSKSTKPVARLLRDITAVALNEKANLQDRIAAVALLAHRPADQSVTAFRQLLSSRRPVALQLATIDAMSAAGGSESLATIVLQRWRELGPTVRSPALSLLLRRSASTRLLLAAMNERKVNPAVVGIDQRVRLLKHPDAKIREAAAKLFGGAVSANRREVAERYLAALKLPATIARGEKVFRKSCAKCHRIDGQGHNVGPDISDVRNRSREALLYDILDPNRKVEPRFTEYTAVTNDGRVYHGLMVSESTSAVVLRQPEGKQQIIARGDIDTLRASGKSLMPEGVEKDVTIQQMADLLEFLKSRRQTSTTKRSRPTGSQK